MNHNLIFPEDAQHHFRRGQLYVSKGESRHAQWELDRAIELDPTLADAYYLRGLLRANFHEYEEAIDDLEQYLTLTPDGLYRAVVVQTIREVQVELSTRYSLFATALLSEGDLAGAKTGFDAALRLSRTNADAYHGRGLTHAAAGKHAQALVDFSQAIAIAPEIPAYYRSRAHALRALGCRVLAVKDEASIRRLPSRS